LSVGHVVDVELLDVQTFQYGELLGRGEFVEQVSRPLTRGVQPAGPPIVEITCEC
jgi:hypothetical protein